MALAEVPSHSSPTPPYSLEAERSVLGAILLSDRTLYGLVIHEGLKVEDFYRPQHGAIFHAMLELYRESEPVDAVTVKEWLRAHSKLDEAGGEAAVDTLAVGVPAAANVRHYAGIVKQQALARRLLTTAYGIAESVVNREGEPRDLVERAERKILEVAHDDRQKDFQRIEDILHAEIEKLHRLSKEKTALTGTPSGFKDLDEITGGFQAGNLVVLAARPSMGKCLGGSALIFDPITGARRRMDEVVAAIERGEPTSVVALGTDLRLRVTEACWAFRNGRKPLFRLTTRLGRYVEATSNHPLLTLSGWRELADLRPGDRIAVPRRLPMGSAPETMPDHEVVMLAALIADGNLTARTPRFWFGADSPVVAEVEAAAREFGVQLRVPGGAPHGTAHISAGRGAPRNPVRELCEAHGIWGLRSENKFVPDAVFRLDDEQIARFLSVLYGCDGHVYATERLRQIGYTTISERLAHDVQHLLLRLGVVAPIRTLRRPVYDGTSKVAREVLVTGQEGLVRFASAVRVCGKTDRLERVVAGIRDVAAATNVDTLPADVWEEVLAAKGDRSWRELSAAVGHPANHNWHVHTRGLSRPRLARLAEATGDRRPEELALSDLWWDEIASITPAGEAETYDITVPYHHNFVADDMVVHNSCLVTNIAENAALDHGKPVALFSLEMSEAELAQRFVASQSNTKGDDLRKGRVSESRWPKILSASQRLAQAPMFIDDSSDVGILEIRAKARRLHQQHRDGLGLIIVDYLQLMRADPGTENRVIQIGEMSRGLKILARELNVPVIALSQLSRAVEQRHDKKPVLSDLRESGAIEQDADLVMFIYRDEYYNQDSERQGEADLLISKHRNGALGDVRLVFQKELPKFLNYAGDRFAGPTG